MEPVAKSSGAAGCVAAALRFRPATFARAMVVLTGAAIIAPAGPGHAADLGYAAPAYQAPPAFFPPPPAVALDPRCVVAPMPQSDLVGDTARFRATAICQSRGLYTDTLMFPGPPVIYRGYSYGYAQ